MTLRELKALDAGKGERIPTLLEVLSALRRRVTVNIELRGRDTSDIHELLIDQINGGRAIDFTFVGEAHSHRISVYPWTIDEPDDIRRVVDMGGGWCDLGRP